DFEFATQFNLPIKRVVSATRPNSAKNANDESVKNDTTKNEPTNNDTLPFTANGFAVNSEKYDGLETPVFKEQISADIEKAGCGRKAVNYKLRDWLFSRQHFWGEPFPILHEIDTAGQITGRVVALEPKDLPIDIPREIKFDAEHNSPEPPLEQASESWLYPVINGIRYKRETNTMPQWAGSCWYYLRYIDPKNKEQFINPELEKKWMPVDLYVGGAEHAVLHLLYARFWHKVLYDRGYVSGVEPFQKLVNQGMILGEDGQKMSKSRGNVINPDDVVDSHGADSLRLYEMFMGPLEAVKPWSTDSVGGVKGFLDRAWRMIVEQKFDPKDTGNSAEENKNGESDDSPVKYNLSPAVKDCEPTEEQNRVLHKTIKGVTHDIRNMLFNTAIAKMMEFTNFFLKQEVRPRTAMEKFVLLLSPFAPHIAEELWEILGHNKTLAYEAWPVWDEAALVESTVEIPISINGKLRSKIVVPADTTPAQLEALALADAKIVEFVTGKEIVKKIVVPGKMVNIVCK
ncbi:MAG: class I tRNA ligase family protein, partial [Thermoguttaceae bacterium]